jgi:hypothetical protein
MNMGADKENTRQERRPVGKEGAGSHQEGKNPVQAGQSQRRERSEPEQNKRDSTNDHQKTVSGKKQHGPEENVDQDAGGNEGSKGQNVDARRSTGTGKEPGDSGDYRGRSRASE